MGGAFKEFLLVEAVVFCLIDGMVLVVICVKAHG